MINSEIGYFFLFLYMLQLIFFISGNFCFPFVFLTMFANKVKTRRKNKNYTRDQKLATRNLARSISIIVQFQKISIPPMKGTFTLDPPPTPQNFLYTLQRVLVIAPQPPGTSIMHCRGVLVITPTHLEFPLCTVGGVCYSPSAPGICIDFQLGWVPSGKYIHAKHIVALYYCPQKIIFLR